MKHLLNNLTEEEKNAIREQHTGGMKVVNENFSKLVNTKLGDVKPMINEQYEENDTDRRQLLLQNESADVVSEHLNNLSESITFIAIINCEYADFSDIDLCSMRNLAFVNLVGTDNNFDEQDYECAEHFGEGLYSLIDKDGKKSVNTKLGDVNPMVNEQSSNLKNEFKNLYNKLKIKYKDICKYDTIKTYEGGNKVVKLNTGGKIYPFDAEVKRFQELQNNLSPEDNLKVDGIIGPEMKKYFCVIN